MKSAKSPIPASAALPSMDTRNFLLPVLAAMLTGSASATTLLSDDFESYTAGSTLFAAAGVPGTIWSKTGTSALSTIGNSSTPFGASNKYLRLIDNLTGSAMSVFTTESTTALNAVTTIQFDFYEPDNSFDGALNFGYGTGDASSGLVGFSSTQARILVNLDDGVIGGVTGGTSTSYSLDTAYTLYLIFNDTAASVTYAGRTLAAHTADVWFKPLGGSAEDAVYAGSTAALDNPPAEGTGYFAAFRTFNAATQEVLIDNLSFYEGTAAFSEPSTAEFRVVITPNPANPGNYDYSWNSQSGKVYDLVSATDLASPVSTWTVWNGQSDLAANPPTNALTNIPGSSGSETKRFFAVVEKPAP